MSIKNARIKLNRQGVVALLKSADVAADLEGRAQRIAASAGEGVEVRPVANRDRNVVFVSTATREARVAEAEHRALSKAIDAGR